MSSKLYETLLADVTRANKERKLKMANKAGFKTVEDYKEYLTKAIANAPVTTNTDPKEVKVEPEPENEPQPVEKPTIHVVDILDCSSSMDDGNKIGNARNAINKGVENLKSDTDVNYTYTICEFAYTADIKFPQFMREPSIVPPSIARADGMTALFDAIGSTLDKMKESVKSDSKVLVNIYTDGGENVSKNYTQEQINRLISELQEQNFTITFIGTDRDVKKVVQELNVQVSNTMSYDGTAKGLANSMNVTLDARGEFKSKVLRGEDVKMGFYKNIVK